LLVLIRTLGRKRASVGAGPCQGIQKRAAGDGENLPRAAWPTGWSQARSQAQRLTTLYIGISISRKPEMEMASQL